VIEYVCVPAKFSSVCLREREREKMKERECVCVREESLSVYVRETEVEVARVCVRVRVDKYINTVQYSVERAQYSYSKEPHIL